MWLSDSVGVNLAEPESRVPPPSRGSYPVRPRNRVRPLIDGEVAFRRICQAIEAARYSVWTTIAFMMPDFLMPDGRGSLFDVLDGAVARGGDVRVIFWRPNPETSRFEPRVFSGTPAQRQMLTERNSQFRIRWDRALTGNCQHQKSWLIDAGQASEIAFVGGINLNPKSVVSPGHPGEGHNHDAYVEIAGPSASDVHHNFVQRWNQASERMAKDGVWGHDGDDELAFPVEASGPQGDSVVQIQRTVRAGRYTQSAPAPNGPAIDIAEGETSIFEQYCLAIRSAQHSVYIENQAFEVSEIVSALNGALERGVEVVVLVPAELDSADHARLRRPEWRAFLDERAALGRYDNFGLAGIAGLNGNGGRSDVYVHAKLMLVDDEWATIGSGNLHANSLFGSTEMNASIWDPAAVRTLRCELFSEHLGEKTAHLDARAALRFYRQVARDNRQKKDTGDSQWQGLAYRLDPATYGR